MTEQQKRYCEVLNDNSQATLKQGIAFGLIDNIELTEGIDLTDEQYETIGAAIKLMLDAPTINSITKEKLRAVIRFLWNNLFEWEENDG